MNTCDTLSGEAVTNIQTAVGLPFVIRTVNANMLLFQKAESLGCARTINHEEQSFMTSCFRI